MSIVLFPRCPLLAAHGPPLSLQVMENWVGAWLGGQPNVALHAFNGASENNVVFLNFDVLFRIRWRRHWRFWTNFRKNRG